MDPNDWQRYRKKGPQSRSGGMDLGIGGSSGSGNLGIADYLTENFDNLGGGSLTPQQELAATQKAIREGGAMKSPQTDVTRFITEAPDGSNYMDPKPAEIPPMLARQITDPTPPAPASGSGINPQMLVRPQGDAQSRGSNLANTMPRREDFRRREAMAAKMEASALEAQNSGFANFMAPDRVNAAVLQRMQGAQALRQQDEADYQASVNQYYIQNPDQYEEWKRRTMIEKKIIPRSAPVNAIDPRTKSLVGIDEYGGKKVYEGVMPQNAYEIGAVGGRMAEDDERKAAEAKLDRALKREIAGLEHSASQGKTDAQNRATAARLAQLQGLAPEAVEYPDNDEKKTAKRHPAGEEAGYLAQGFIMVEVENDDGTTQRVPVRPKKVLVPRPGQAQPAAPAAGAKGAAPAPAAKGDATRGGRAKVTPVG